MIGERPTVVAYDGSEDARHAMAVAAELFLDRLAYVVNVWRPMPKRDGALLGMSKSVTDRGIERLDAEAAMESEGLVEDAAGIGEALGLRVKPLSVSAEGPPWAAIVQVAENQDAAAVVVGSRGLSLVSGAVPGSVSGGVLRHTRRPVVVVPRRTERAPEARRSTAADENRPARPAAVCAQSDRR